MIITNTVILIIPETVLYAGWAFSSSPPWNRGYDIIERIQITWFSTQEILLSAIYIMETIKLLRISPTEDKRRNMILYELIAINLIAISMDICLTVLEFLGFYFIQVGLKPLVYSIKLKLEFAVLGMLVYIVSRSLLTGHADPGYSTPNVFYLGSME
jgi:hypothetical protein